MTDEQITRVAYIGGLVKRAKAFRRTGKALARPGGAIGRTLGRYAPHLLLGFGAYTGYRKTKDKVDEVRVSQAQRTLMRQERRQLIRAARDSRRR